MLAAHGVEYIVVGGVSAVLQGAPMTTFDLDLVHSRSTENIERLLRALDALDAHARGRSGPRVRPDRSHLESPGHQLLMTSQGPLDLLGAVGGNRDYQDLLAHCVELRVGEMVVRVIDLDTLIELKEAAGREKDKATLDILRRTRDEARRSDGN
ncbi:MAG TPA: hypothetical protein VJV75_05995 [Candidatus Polarisedimenticolia bacterium]|nr:hypothetical protein [Candidatus Polarisedimenticolia bacterium]